MTKKNISVAGGLRTSQEAEEAGLNRAWFEKILAAGKLRWKTFQSMLSDRI